MTVAIAVPPTVSEAVYDVDAAIDAAFADPSLPYDLSVFIRIQRIDDARFLPDQQ